MRDGGDGGEAGAACAVDGREGGRAWVADVERGHAAGFGAAEFGEDGADLDVLDEGGVEVGIAVEYGFESLRLGDQCLAKRGKEGGGRIAG